VPDVGAHRRNPDDRRFKHDEGPSLVSRRVHEDIRFRHERVELLPGEHAVEAHATPEVQAADERLDGAFECVQSRNVQAKLDTPNAEQPRGLDEGSLVFDGVETRHVHQPGRLTGTAWSRRERRPRVETHAERHALRRMTQGAHGVDHDAARRRNTRRARQREAHSQLPTPCSPAAVPDVGHGDELATGHMQQHRPSEQSAGRGGNASGRTHPEGVQ